MSSAVAELLDFRVDRDGLPAVLPVRGARLQRHAIRAPVVVGKLSRLVPLLHGVGDRHVVGEFGVVVDLTDDGLPPEFRPETPG